MGKNDFVTVGCLGKPHGIKGELELVILTDFPERFYSGAAFLIRSPLTDTQRVTIGNVKKKGGKLIIKLEGVDAREQAEAISGWQLVIPAEEVARLPEDTYWHHDLIGLNVFTMGGRKLGAIREVMSGAANDVYVVRDGKEYLIPAIGEVIKEIDLKNRRMTIEPIPGLLE